MKLFGHMISSLEQGLNYSATKGKVISQNIANVDTPNYKAKNVSFKDFFDNAQMKELRAYKTDHRHIDFPKRNVQPGVFDYSNFRYRHDGNGVDMDKEQADLAENQIYYHALVDRLNGKFNTLQNVIKGGR
ncbi:flagellar basal body rod protein FlgB [Sporosarcina pasteurii]|uniref:Flagellar basal body rod protein FlgB n=1 Tax=Sporosarcina pasteurii TaxID=1474 RepID=A0A380BHH8_SPOPA|nr:flagellar basal body rod protein FlgB [Sporosarcina pasteurii]MDS9470575.1 flagellar basal body rod protein FlgB [Sporosarcina pasteurii]QBQ05735.1 flagellar basal body rod protein FlgB [Sporosarcina pasteurii]SUJ00722.1 Flagellar basal body rod protein FlgB [Sporosarcina pasteurii]